MLLICLLKKQETANLSMLAVVSSFPALFSAVLNALFVILRSFFRSFQTLFLSLYRKHASSEHLRSSEHFRSSEHLFLSF